MVECIYVMFLIVCMIRLFVFVWYFVFCLCYYVMFFVEILGLGCFYLFCRDLFVGCGGKWFREVENSSINDGFYFVIGWLRWWVCVFFEDF